MRMSNFQITIDPNKLDYKHLASEITRAMTNVRLNKEQQDTLKYVAEEVLRAKLQYRSENLQLILDREEDE